MMIIIAFLFFRLLLMVVFPVSDPSEARYSVIAKNMAETGDYVVPRLIHNGVMQSFDGKPPLYFQTAAVVSELLGVSSFSVRLPSFLSALIILFMIYLAVRRHYEDKVAICAVVCCLSSVYFYIMSGVALTDMMLAMCITGAIFSYSLFLNAAERKHRRGWSILFFVFLGLGMISKGPVAVALAGLPVFLYTLINRKWRDLHDHAWILGPTAFLAIALPWYVMMTLENADFLEYFFINENIKRFLFEEYGDRYGSGRTTFRGMALIWFVVVNLPFVAWLLVPLVKKRKIICRSDFTNSLSGLSILGCASITAFWCLTSRVPISYLLPTVPLCAVFCAIKLHQLGFMRNTNYGAVFNRGFTIFCSMVVLGMIVAGIAGVVFSSNMPEFFYQKLVNKLKREQPDSTSQLYFAGRTPYSADFFLPPEMIIHHDREKIPMSLQNSSSRYLVISERNLKKLDAPMERKLFLKYYEWLVFAPEGEK